MISEEQYIALLRQADNEARSRLYHESVKEFSAICRRFLREENDIHDALHDAYITIFTRIDCFTYIGEGSLYAWMRRIVVNQCINVLRQQNCSFIVSIEDLSSMERQSIISYEDTATLSLDNNQLTPETLHGLIASLPIGFRTVFCLYAIEGLNHKEIARLLGISEGTSASQYSRAKRLLAQLIKQRILENQ